MEVFALIQSCVLCDAKFEASHRTALCPDCRYPKCVICGKPFKLVNPYTQKTCSKRCAGEYRKREGISKEVVRKASETLMERYGVSNANAVSKPTETKICPLCGIEFLPDTFRQVYCKNKHYGPCPVCGKSVEIKEICIGPQCCSEECRQKRIANTCIEKYGNACVLNSDYGKEKTITTCMEKYGVDKYSKSDEFKIKFKATSLERFGVSVPTKNPVIKAKIIATNIERYGGHSPTCDPKICAKGKETVMRNYGGYGKASPILKERIEATCIKKYGYANPMNSQVVRDKVLQTFRERFGVDHPLKLPEIRDKVAKTNLERYGYAYILQDPKHRDLVRAKMTKALMERYGVDNPSKSPILLTKISDTMLKRYGVPWYVFADACKSKNSYHRISKINEHFSRQLIDHGVAHIMEYCLDNKFFDFKVGDTLIEIDPTITHNAYMSVFKGHKPKEPNYQASKTKIANNHGYHCIHIFDWDDVDKILNTVLPCVTINAEDCNLAIIPMSLAKEFLCTHHIQNDAELADICYGLYYDDTLIQVMAFGPPQYDVPFDYEMHRVCTRFGYSVINGEQKLFDAFVSNNPNHSVVTYCDLSKFSKSVYFNMGMHLNDIKPISINWSYKNRCIPDIVLQQFGYNNLFHTDFDSSVSDSELMIQHGWLPVYDCGQAEFVFGE